MLVAHVRAAQGEGTGRSRGAAAGCMPGLSEETTGTVGLGREKLGAVGTAERLPVGELATPREVKTRPQEQRARPCTMAPQRMLAGPQVVEQGKADLDGGGGHQGYDTTLHDTTQQDATRRETTRHDTTNCDTIRYDMTRHDRTQHDPTRRGTT